MAGGRRQQALHDALVAYCLRIIRCSYMVQHIVTYCCTLLHAAAGGQVRQDLYDAPRRPSAGLGSLAQGPVRAYRDPRPAAGRAREREGAEKFPPPLNSRYTAVTQPLHLRHISVTCPFISVTYRYLSIASVTPVILCYIRAAPPTYDRYMTVTGGAEEVSGRDAGHESSQHGARGIRRGAT